MQTKAEKYKNQQKNFKKTSHIFNKKVFHWPFCSGCGMVLLKNERSSKQASMPCQSMEE